MSTLFRLLSLDRIASQVTAVLIGASLVSFTLVTATITTVLSSRDYPSSAAEAPIRIATVLEGLNGLPALERPQLVAAYGREDLRITLDRVLSNDSASASDHPLRTTIFAHVPPGVRLLSIKSASSNVVEVQARLEDGQAVTVYAQFSRLALLPLPPLFFYLSFMLLTTMLVSIWVARRIVAPLGRFATAANRFGDDGTGEPLVEDGPAEVRRASSAFNRMRTRIMRLIEDRTNLLLAISHDLRTPLTRLRLRAEELDGGAAADRKRMLDDIQSMDSSITAAVTYLREGITGEPIEQADVPSILSTICDQFSDAGYVVEYEGPARLATRCQPLALGRAVNNLVDNATKYGSRVTVSLVIVAGRFVIAVEDNGPGIPDDEKAKVVKPFYRSDPARQDIRGFGLGLAIVSRIAEVHGGTLTLKDRPTGGLRAELSLPLR